MIDGVDVMIGAEHVQSFSLAPQELAANAAKYGTLSNESGKVKIFWTIARDGKDNRLKFKWKVILRVPLGGSKEGRRACSSSSQCKMWNAFAQN